MLSHLRYMQLLFRQSLSCHGVKSLFHHYPIRVQFCFLVTNSRRPIFVSFFNFLWYVASPSLIGTQVGNESRPVSTAEAAKLMPYRSKTFLNCAHGLYCLLTRQQRSCQSPALCHSALTEYLVKSSSNIPASNSIAGENQISWKQF